MGIATTQLTPVEQTAFLTVYARALDSRRRRPILGDRLADEVVGKIDYDFGGLGVQASVVCQTALRAKMLDHRVRDFTHKHHDAVVVDLGAGLDSGFYRVDPPPSVDWYSVDLPGILALRDEALPTNPHSHSVPVSLAEKHWPETIPGDRPTMLIADGLFAFLPEPVIVAIFRRITDHFSTGEFAFMTTAESAGSANSRSSCTKMFKDVGSQWGYAGLGCPPSGDVESADEVGRGGQPCIRTEVTSSPAGSGGDQALWQRNQAHARPDPALCLLGLRDSTVKPIGQVGTGQRHRRPRTGPRSSDRFARDFDGGEAAQRRTDHHLNLGAGGFAGQKYGPPPPNAKCGFGDRRMSKRKGSTSTFSSRFAEVEQADRSPACSRWPPARCRGLRRGRNRSPDWTSGDLLGGGWGRTDPLGRVSWSGVPGSAISPERGHSEWSRCLEGQHHEEQVQLEPSSSIRQDRPHVIGQVRPLRGAQLVREVNSATSAFCCCSFRCPATDRWPA
jgi:O-methyltransferase involved in polyketide biosynthesis